MGSFLTLIEVAGGGIAVLIAVKVLLSVFGRGTRGAAGWTPVFVGISLILAVVVFGPALLHLVMGVLTVHAAPGHPLPTPVPHGTPHPKGSGA